MVEGAPILTARQIFEAKYDYIVSSGIGKKLAEEAIGREGINDETLWEFHRSQFHGQKELRLVITKKSTDEKGRKSRGITVEYDGVKLTIKGVALEGSFGLERGVEVPTETMEQIESAIKRAFINPWTSFLSHEDLLSSD